MDKGLRAWSGLGMWKCVTGVAGAQRQGDQEEKLEVLAWDKVWKAQVARLSSLELIKQAM